MPLRPRPASSESLSILHYGGNAMNWLFRLCLSKPCFLTCVSLLLCGSLVCWAQDPRAVSAMSYLERGNEWQSKGELDRAIADFNLALTFDPDFAGAHLSRGLAYQAKG